MCMQVSSSIVVSLLVILEHICYMKGKADFNIPYIHNKRLVTERISTFLVQFCV